MTTWVLRRPPAPPVPAGESGPERGPGRRGRTAARAAVAAAAMALFSTVLLTAGSPAHAGERPSFQLPFACGSTVRMETGSTHDRARDKLLDMYRPPSHGEPVLAAAAGTAYQRTPGGGDLSPGGVMINHGNGWFTMYLHMDNRIANGTRVRQGQQIGTMGKVGTGVSHLHYEQFFDSNNNGWGDSGEWTNPVFNGVSYSLGNGQPSSVTVTSRNCQGASLDGNARSEIVSVNGDGSVWAYQNAGMNGTGTYPGPAAHIASGWSDPARIRFADVDGDGRDEIIAINGDGTVWAYWNAGFNGGNPYPHAPAHIASGWTDPARTRFADIDGDGRAEIIAIDGDGTVRAYWNAGMNGTGTYPHASSVIGTGWTDPTRTFFA